MGQLAPPSTREDFNNLFVKARPPEMRIFVNQWLTPPDPTLPTMPAEVYGHDGPRHDLCKKLAGEGFPVDYQIDYDAREPYTTMLWRTWENLGPLVMSMASGKSIKVSLDPADYPAWPEPIPAPPEVTLGFAYPCLNGVTRWTVNHAEIATKGMRLHDTAGASYTVHKEQAGIGFQVWATKD